jgi:hypothetical protein
LKLFLEVIELKLLLKLLSELLSLDLLLAFLNLNCSLVLELFVIDFDLLLCLDLFPLMIECPLHLVLESALLLFKHFELCLVTLLQLLKGLSVPAILPGQILQFTTLTVLSCLKSLSGLFEMSFQEGYLIT